MTRPLLRSLKYPPVLFLVLISAGAILGSGQVGELLRSVQAMAVQQVGGMIPDEVKLRNDIEKLREEYPRRITGLKSMTADLSRQLLELEEDRQLCREVLALCEEDLSQLRPGVEAQSADPAALPAGIRFRGESFSYQQALERSRKVSDLQDLYQARLTSVTASVELLRSERGRLCTELDRLRVEYDQLIAQYRCLEREIDLLQQNQRLIGIAGRLERLNRLDSASWLRSLGSIKAAIERRRTEQEERLRDLKVGNPVSEYETRAASSRSRRRAM